MLNPYFIILYYISQNVIQNFGNQYIGWIINKGINKFGLGEHSNMLYTFEQKITDYY